MVTGAFGDREKVLDGYGVPLVRGAVRSPCLIGEIADGEWRETMPGTGQALVFKGGHAEGRGGRRVVV